LTKIAQPIRKHSPFLIILPLLIIVMTWPALLHVADGQTIAYPTRNIDVWQKQWDIWHWEQFLAGNTSFYHTDVMFHPAGLSLAFENFSLPHMIAASLLGAFLPPANAYTLTYLFIIFAVALSAYVYLNYLLRDRWLATLGAAVFGLNQHIIGHAAHPDVNLLVSLPLTVYFFERALREARFRHIVYCGLTVGLTAYMSLYIFVCALITLALMALAYAVERWRELRFWRWMLALGLVIALVSAGRMAPMLADASDLASAFSKNSAKETGTDLLSYFVNFRHPLTAPLLKSVFQADSPFYEPQTSYLGYLPLALIIIGFFRSGCRRKLWPWLALGLPFFLLRLGSVLRVDGHDYSDIVLPKSVLDEFLPPIFSPFHAPDHFQMGLLLPLAVLTCYGLKSLLGSRPPKQRILVTLAVIVLVAFEYYESPAPRIVPAQQLAFIEALGQDGAGGAPRLINLPIGRQHAKLYGYYQTLTGYPQVEGLTGRTPTGAYAYIDGNFLLSAWKRGDGVHCYPPLRADFSAGLSQLQADGFTYIVWHHWLAEDMPVASSFVDLSATYKDDYVAIYRVDDLHQSCDLSSAVSPAAQAALRRLDSSTAIIPGDGSAILSLLPAAGGERAPEENGAAVLLGPYSYEPLKLEAGVVQAKDSQGEALEALLTERSVILLVHDPRTADPAAIDGYREWLGPLFKACRRVTETDEAVIEYFMRAGFNCELAFAAEPLEVHYANGAQLGNRQVHVESGSLEVSLLWTRLPVGDYVVSIQLFDADGARALGADFVIGSEPLDRYQINTSSVAPGDYRVQMIVYDYHTGDAVAGVIAADETGFARELEIGELHVK